MRKFSLLLSVLVLAAMILAACGGEETSTNIPSTNVPPVTIEATATSSAGSATATEMSTATEAPTEATTTETPGTSGIPVTGAANSDRLSNELNFTVLDQTGEQAGKVDDMVLDLSRAKVLYVVVNAGGKKIPVPWALLKAGPASASGNTNEQQNAFTLQADTDTLKNAPELNLKNMPQMGESPDSWDISIRKYWQGGGATSANNTPSPAGTAVTDMTTTATSTSNSAGVGTGNVSSTPAISAGTSQGTGTGQGATSIQGVELASKVLGAKVTVGAQDLGLGTSTPGAAGAGTGLATSTPSTGTSLATSTPSTSTGLPTSTPSAGTSLATSTPGAGTGLTTTSTPSTSASAKNLSATINDMIVNSDAGEIMYMVIKTSFDDGEHLIPVPLRLFKLDSNNEAFVLTVDPAMLQNAPFFQKDQFPDMTMPDWTSEFDTFWQNNGSGGGSGTGTATGSGSAAQATATP